jgi:hypothetical protein
MGLTEGGGGDNKHQKRRRDEVTHTYVLCICVFAFYSNLVYSDQESNNIGDIALHFKCSAFIYPREDHCSL